MGWLDILTDLVSQSCLCLGHQLIAGEVGLRGRCTVSRERIHTYTLEEESIYNVLFWRMGKPLPVSWVHATRPRIDGFGSRFLGIDGGRYLSIHRGLYLSRSSKSIYQILCWSRPRSAVSLLHATRRINWSRFLGIRVSRFLGIRGGRYLRIEYYYYYYYHGDWWDRYLGIRPYLRVRWAVWLLPWFLGDRLGMHAPGTILFARKIDWSRFLGSDGGQYLGIHGGRYLGRSSIYHQILWRPQTAVPLLQATRKIDGSRFLGIDGGRYLGIDGGRYLGVYGVDNYYISVQPQLIKGERMNVGIKGLIVFKIDGGDSDYFDIVTLGILMWNDCFKNYTAYDDYCNTWVGGDKKLFDLLAKQYDYEYGASEEIIYLPPFVYKYPRNSEKIPAQWTLDRLLVVCLAHTIRLCAEMRNEAQLSSNAYEKDIYPPPASEPLFSDTDSDSDSDSGPRPGWFFHGRFTKDEDNFLELPYRRFLAIGGNGKYCISNRPEPIEQGERIPSRAIRCCMFRIDRCGDCYDLVSFGIINYHTKDESACVCGDELLHSEMLSYIYRQPERYEWCIKEDPVLYLPPLVVKYPKKDGRNPFYIYEYVEGGDRISSIPEKPGYRTINLW